MNKIAYKLPEGVKVLSHKVIDGQVVVTYEESKKLRLEVNEVGTLCIMYGDKTIGTITKEGQCMILITETRRETYLEWVKDGMLVDNSEVEWRGKKYCIDQFLQLRCNNMCEGEGIIYSFKKAIYCPGCLDNNIQRYPHNFTPIAY